MGWFKRRRQRKRLFNKLMNAGLLEEFSNNLELYIEALNNDASISSGFFEQVMGLDGSEPESQSLIASFTRLFKINPEVADFIRDYCSVVSRKWGSTKNGLESRLESLEHENHFLKQKNEFLLSLIKDGLLRFNESTELALLNIYTGVNYSYWIDNDDAHSAVSTLLNMKLIRYKSRDSFALTSDGASFCDEYSFNIPWYLDELDNAIIYLNELLDCVESTHKPAYRTNNYTRLFNMCESLFENSGSLRRFEQSWNTIKSCLELNNGHSHRTNYNETVKELKYLINFFGRLKRREEERLSQALNH